MKALFSQNVRRTAVAEIAYNRFTLALLFLTLTLTFNMFNSLEQSGVKTDPILAHLSACALMYLLFTPRLLEKRTRFIQLTPLSVGEHAVVRLASQSAYMGFVLIAYTVSALVYLPSDLIEILVWRTLSFNALLLISNALFNISLDVWSESDAKAYNGLFITMMWLFFILYASLYGESWLVSLMQQKKTAFFKFFYFSPIGVLLQHAVAFAVNYYSVKFFIHRKSKLT